MRTLLILCFLGLSLLSITAYAEEEVPGDGLLDNLPIPIEISAESAIYSDYVWRGFLLDDDPVIQPGVTIGSYGLSFTFWSNFDLVSDDGRNSDEIDLALDYTYEHDLFSLSAGHTWYFFPPSNTDTQEFYIGGGINIPVGDEITLSPTLTWTHDYGDTDDGGANGDYLTLALARSIPLFDTAATLDLNAEIAWNHEFFIAGDGGYSLLGAGLTIPLVGETIAFSPNANISLPFGDLEDNNDGAQDIKFYYGGVLTFSY